MVVPQGPHKEAREALGRAIRRLNVLEYVILAVIAGLSLLGGALIAVLAVQLLGVPFRLTWAFASILVFILPAAVVWRRERRAEREEADPQDDAHPSHDENG